jgi:hypothetical protein
MKYAVAVLLGFVQVNALRLGEYPQPDIRGANAINAHGDSTFSSTLHNDWTNLQMREYPQPDIRGANAINAHPDSTFSSTLHNDWTNMQMNEYPQPDIRGAQPKNGHPDSTFSSHLHNDWTLAQQKNREYPQPDIRGAQPKNGHPDSTFSSHLHNDWTLAQQKKGEYPQPDIRGPQPQNAHPDSTFSSHVHNDWTHAQVDNESESDEDSDDDLALDDSEDSSDDDMELAQLADDDVKTIDHFVPGFSGAGAQGGYERQIPSRFVKMYDDQLMESLIKTYSIEMKTSSGGPSGHFFLDKEGAAAVSKEVLHNNFSFDGKKADVFFGEHFDNTWTHFDVNNDRLIEVERMPTFLRYFLGDALNNGL